MKKQHFCIHCNTKTNEEDLIDGKFCCPGCKAAYKTVKGFGLVSYYKSRITDPNIKSIKPEPSEEMDLKSFISKDQNNNFELFLAIEGMSCAACVWLIETILKKQENVTLARVNLTKKYLRLKWLGSESDGIRLVDLIQQIGYKLYPFEENVLLQESKKYSDELIRKLAVAGFGAGNIMLFSFALWFYDIDHMGRQMRNLMHFFTAMIALPCIIYSSSVFFKSAFLAIRAKRMNMDIPIATAIFLTVTVSFYQIFHEVEHIYFDSAMTLCFFLLIGRYLDFKAKKKAFNVSKEFLLLNSGFARVIDAKGQTKIVAAKDLKRGMIIIVNAGEKIAADGVVIEGDSQLDNNSITGESRPIATKVGDPVYASAINLSGSLKIKIEKSQQYSLLKQIQEIIEEGEGYKSKFVRIADRVAGYYTPIVHIVAGSAFVYWYFFANIGAQESLLIAIATLVITCPCALALAVPIAQSLTISTALKNGIIIKSGAAIEKINQITRFIFDKTGTLTHGKPKLVKIAGLNRDLNKSEQEYYLAIAADLANNSSHPLSKAICESCNKNRSHIMVAEEKGYGISAKINDKIAKLGKEDYVDNFDSKYQDEIDNNFSTTFLSYEGDVVIFYFQDIAKEDAKEFINFINSKYHNSTLLSGDNEEVVNKTAKDLNIEKSYAKKDPIEKAIILDEIRKQGVKFAMVGDGINDAAALAKSDISISFSNATNLTQNVADVIITGERLMPIANFIKLTKKSSQIVRQNLAFCILYNALAIPFAVSGLVNPLIAAIAMSSSSLIVVLNSIRVKIK